MRTFISRRELLKRAGLVGAAAVIAPTDTLRLDAAAPATLEPQVAAPVPAASREALEHLTATESNVLEAFAARLIPSDGNGPGAKEARAARYIDHALGGALASSHQAYTAGLAALDQYSRSSRGKSFTELSGADQDAVLTDVESGAASGFPDSSAFFSMVRFHTIQGTFCDPYYGGNASFVGWDLLGYPGVRTAVGPEEQHLGVQIAPNHKSAYDYAMFAKASARAGGTTGGRDGD